MMQILTLAQQISSISTESLKFISFFYNSFKNSGDLHESFLKSLRRQETVSKESYLYHRIRWTISQQINRYSYLPYIFHFDKKVHYPK